METRHILAYHHQFFSMRKNALGVLYAVVDLLRLEVRGHTEGYSYYDASSRLVEFLKEEPKRPKVGRGCQVPLDVDPLAGHVCMMVDLGNGFVSSLGFPVALDGKLWFPTLSSRLITDLNFYHQISSLERPPSVSL